MERMIARLAVYNYYLMQIAHNAKKVTDYILGNN